MVGKVKILPAQRRANGELVFFMPRLKGSQPVDYKVALAEMREKYGRKDLPQNNETSS